jgi:UrcA family protein
MRYLAPIHKVRAAQKSKSKEIAMSTFKTFHSPTAWLSTVTALACTLTSGTVLAAPATDQVPAIVVSYADLDVSKPAGIETLYRRIDYAARQVCAPLAGRDIRRTFLWRECRSEAMAAAVSTINRPMLTALHERKARTFG